jgi:hypothetical protein
VVVFGAAGDPYNAADYAFNIHGEEVKVAPSFRYLGVEMPRAIDTASVAPIEPVRREDILARMRGVPTNMLKVASGTAVLTPWRRCRFTTGVSSASPRTPPAAWCAPTGRRSRRCSQHM